MSNLVNIEINGRLVSVKVGSTVLQACEVRGIEIPRFCYHERLLIAGNCRMCLVEVVGSPKPQASCALPVSRGPGGAVMKIVTDSPIVKKAREGVLEMLLVNHPLDCPICDQGGECDLQDQSIVFGSDRSRMYEGKRGVEDKDRGPLVKTVITRCIHCTRCIRFASEIAGVADLGTSGRGRETEVGTYVEKIINSERSGNRVDLCPVGALTSKPYAFKARPQERDSTEIVDAFDGFGASIKVQVRGNEVMRVLPVQNDHLNGEQLGDKSRFSIDGLNIQRIDTGYVRKEHLGRLSPVDIPVVMNRVEQVMKESKDIKFRLSSEVSLEMIQDTRRRAERLRNNGKSVRVEGRGVASSSDEARGRQKVYENTVSSRNEADVVLLAGVDPRKESPLLNVKLREGFLRGTREVYSLGNTRNRTYPVHHVGITVKELQKIVEGEHELSVALAEAKKPVIRVGAGRQRREDESNVRSRREQRNLLVEEVGKVEKGQKVRNVVHHRPNSAGLMRSNVKGFRGFSEQSNRNQSVVVIVGVSKGELKELGQKNPTFKCKYILGLNSQGDSRIGQCDAVLPRPTFVETASSQVNREGTPQNSLKVVTTAFGENQSNVDYRQRARLAAEKEKKNSSRDRTRDRNKNGSVITSLVTVINSPRTPAVHDYYLEGHGASRRSETMAKSSLAFKTHNFVEL